MGRGDSSGGRREIEKGSWRKTADGLAVKDSILAVQPLSDIATHQQIQ